MNRRKTEPGKLTYESLENYVSELERFIKQMKGAIPAYTPRPCDCIELREWNGDEYYAINCFCGNTGDLQTVSRWCEATDIANRFQKIIDNFEGKQS